jgi:Tfp pilus assembly protein PilO
MNAYWNNLRPLEKRMLVAVAAVLFLVLNAWFVVPHFSDWSIAQDRLSKARKKLDRFQKEIGQADTYKMQIQRLESESQDVPSEDQSIHFVSTIQSQAAQSGVNIIQVGRVQPRTNDPFFVELTQTLGVQSKEQNLVDFLYKLGSGNSLIRVRDLGLGPDPPHQQLNAKITLVASYQRKPSSSSKSAAAPAPPAPTKSPAPTTKPPKPETKPTVQTNKPVVPVKPGTPIPKRT